MIDRRVALLSLTLAAATVGLGACGGSNSRLRTVHSPTGSGAVDFSVKNTSDSPVNSLYLAKTERLNAAGPNLEFDSPRGQELWGPDLLSRSAIGAGQQVKIEVPEPGLWDVRADDRDGRYQHITGLHLGAGGRYVLELNDGGWRVK